MNSKWEEGTPAPVGRSGHTAVWLNGLVYVGGGYESGIMKASYTIDRYNPVSNQWNSSVNVPYGFFAMTTIDNKLVIAGGQGSFFIKTNKIITLEAGQLRNYTKMIIARTWATAAGYQGMLIITGGKDDKGNILSSTELFDCKNGQWHNCSDLPMPHYSLRSIIVDNILYLLGGFNKHSPSSEVFTSPLDTLSTHQLMWNTHQDTPWCASTPVSINGTHLLIVGGYKNGKYTSDIHKLNKVSHSWEAIGHIPSARRLSAAVSTVDNRVIVIGGANKKGEVTNTVWIGSCEPQ